MKKRQTRENRNAPLVVMLSRTVLYFHTVQNEYAPIYGSKLFPLPLTFIMSRAYKIHTAQAFPLIEMITKMTELLDFRPMCGMFRHPTYYFYNYGSLRGVEITADKGFIIIRTTILSNSHDHQMAGSMISSLLKLTGGTLTNDEDKNINPHFYYGNILELNEEDLSVVKTFLEKNRDVQIIGPFGAYDLKGDDVYSLLKSNKSTHTKMFQLQKILKKPYDSYFEKIRV